MTWDTFSKPKAAAWTPLQMGQAYSAKLMEFGALNINSAMKFAGELAKAKSPTEFANAVSNGTREQFETLTEQIEELSQLFGANKSNDDGADKAGLGD